MSEIYHLKIKKEYAAELIEDLIKVKAVEYIDPMEDLQQWQKDALDIELQNMVNERSQRIPWNTAKEKFIQPD